MGAFIKWTRYLEPVGQAIAFAAFSVQFFNVDPASTDLMRAYFNREQSTLVDIENLLARDYRPGLPEMLLQPSLSRLRAIPIESADSRKALWRPWLFWLFAIGGVLTILGKSASVRYSTR